MSQNPEARPFRTGIAEIQKATKMSPPDLFSPASNITIYNAHRIARETGQFDQEIELLLVKALQANVRGDLKKGLEISETSYRLALTSDSPALQTRASAYCVNFLLNMGDQSNPEDPNIKKAQEYAEKSLEHARETKNKTRIMGAYVTVAQVPFMQEKWQVALELAQTGQYEFGEQEVTNSKEAKAMSDLYDMSLNSLMQMNQLDEARGDLTKLKNFLHKLDRLRSKDKSLIDEREYLSLRATYLSRSGEFFSRRNGGEADVEMANKQFGEALTVATNLKDQQAILAIRRDGAEGFIRIGQIAKAREWADIAMKMAIDDESTTDIVYINEHILPKLG